MANIVKVEIQTEKGVWKEWKNVASPVKYGMLLDEQLDYATVTLLRITKKEFKPLTRARLTITSNTEYGGKQGGVIDYFIANDDFYEAPVGSGVYNHELTLIELTKFLECFQLETLCFTNPTPSTYGKGGILPEIEVTFNDIYEGEMEGIDDDFMFDYSTSEYLTPSVIGTKYNLLDRRILSVYEDACIVEITNKNGTSEYRKGKAEGAIDDLSEVEFTIEEGENRITYWYGPAYKYKEEYLNKAEFVIYGGLERHPLKPWTVYEVLERILQLVEPLRKNQSARFKLAPIPAGKEKLFEQFAPEFTFTRQTLREALKTVGGFIHAEPRLRDIGGEYCIDFDYYGEQELAIIKNNKANTYLRLCDYKYRTLQSRYGIEQAATKLDSYQDNLVNRVNWEQGTVSQPYRGGAQTLRTETAYMRGEENDNFFFPSSYGIDRVVKFEYLDDAGKAYDITPYIYESKVYNNLSSYGKNFPYSKTYALYYSQGENGIKGFFFKPEGDFNGVLENYSIVNIIEAVSNDKINSSDYPNIKFRLTYTPIYSGRVQQSRAYLNDYLPLPRTLNHTQSDNSVEARFFGENIKGTIARMGNAEKTYTLNLRNFDNIPKAGQLWDNEYYIASVSVSVNADLFEVSVGLSKNFNRISQYIGANSHRRIYEVSETMVQQRHTVYTDYVVITDDDLTDKIDNTGLFIWSSGATAVQRMFMAPTDNEPDLSIHAVVAQGKSKNGTERGKVLLPVVSSAFGNAMEFTWEYKDNFSAGMRMKYVKYRSVGGYFGYEVEYSDYYGRLYYYDFGFLPKTDSTPDAHNLPEYDGNLSSVIAGTKGNSLIERKDSRESLKKSYVLEFVTDNNAFVIGSALASMNPLVNYNPNRKQPHLYILPYRVNKFATHIDLSAQNVYNLGPVEPDSYTAANKLMVIHLEGKTTTNSGLAWAYAIPMHDGEPYTVEDEDGNVETITPRLGGELLIAKNVDVKPYSTVGEFYMEFVHDVFQYMKIKNG